MDDKKYKNLIKAIKSSVVLDDEFQMYLVNYVNGIRNGSLYNEFFDFEFLNAIILELCNNEITLEEGETFKEKFESIIRNIRFVLPDGIETDNYEEIKQSIIMGRGINDYEFYSIFDDRHDYFHIVNIIKANQDLYEYKNNIRNFAIEVSPFFSSSELKREIIAYMNGIKMYAGNISDYTKERILEVKKKNGIYPIDEATLANISQMAEQAQSLIKKLENMKSKIEAYEERASIATVNGKDEIDRKAKNAKEELQIGIDEALEGIQKQLNEYLLILEKSLKNSSDEIFNSILKSTEERVNNIKLYAEGLSGHTTSELLRIQRVAEEKIDTLKNYLQNEPELRKLISEAAGSEAVKQAIIDGNYQFGQTSSGVAQPSIIVPDNSGIGPSIKIPADSVDRTILPAFDEKIPFKERFGKVIEEKEKREKSGELFHKITDEVIKCIMEGDWVYLWGPSGGGKSYLIDQIASLLGIELLENRKITDEYTIMAYNDPYGRFRPTYTFEALLYGKLLLNEEMDSDDPLYQVVFNKLYSGFLKTQKHPDNPHYISFGERMNVPIHPNFRMVSTGNTKGLGGNKAYSVRDKMDESVQERMVIKKMDYDDRVEEKIFGEYKDWYNVFLNMRKACLAYSEEHGIKDVTGMITTRDAEALVRYINHGSKTIDQIMREKFVQNKDVVYLRSISDYFKSIYNINDNGKLIETDELSKSDELTLVKSLIYRCNNPE